MATQQQHTARTVYRQLMRVLKRELSNDWAQWHEYVSTEFRRQAGSARDLEIRVKLAEDYCFMVTNIAHHRELLRSYNIGLAEDERTKKMVEAVARRVGFALPNNKAPQPSET